MVRSTLTLLALFNVAILFPGKAMSQNSEGREFNGKYQKEYLDKIAFPIGGIGAGMFCLAMPIERPFPISTFSSQLVEVPRKLTPS